MNKRDDQVIFGTGQHGACGNYDFGSPGVMPPTETFNPGDMVHYYDRPDCIGIITARALQEVEYEGLTCFTAENVRKNAAEDRPLLYGKVMIDFYTVVWNTGTVRTAGAHHLHQLRRVP